MKKLLLVINPISGKAAIRDHLLDVVVRFNREGYEVVVYPTKKRGDATDKMADARFYDRVIVSGGDGTLNEVVSGVIKHRAITPIGYLPTGTTNDFATTLDIPKNMEGALDICLTGKPCAIDVGQFNNRIFNYVAAFGAFTDVPYETPQPRKNLLGGLAYLIEGLLKLPTIHPYECQITYPEGQLEGEFIFGMVSNSDSVAGIKNAFGNTAELRDGLFEVTLIKNPRNIIDIQQLLVDFLYKKFDPEYVIIFQTSRIQISSREEMKWTLDGEAGGYFKEADIINLPQRVNIIMPHK